MCVFPHTHVDTRASCAHSRTWVQVLKETTGVTSPGAGCVPGVLSCLTLVLGTELWSSVSAVCIQSLHLPSRLLNFKCRSRSEELQYMGQWGEAENEGERTTVTWKRSLPAQFLPQVVLMLGLHRFANLKEMELRRLRSDGGRIYMCPVFDNTKAQRKMKTLATHWGTSALFLE